MHDHVVVPDRTEETPSERVEADLRRRISENEWEPGEQLPSVGRLAEQYDVSRSSVTSALQRMQKDGLVVIRAGWGTFRARA